jgi:putative PIN family toxin of toxin-antitoxin system
LTPVDAAASKARRVVLDTNVLLSLWVFADSRYQPIRAALDCGTWVALTDAACLAEFERVLGYPEFKLESQTQRDILADFAGLACPVPPAACLPLPQCADPDDQKFIELACSGAASCIVTSDKALLKLARHRTLREKLGIGILSPQCFMESCL